MALSEVGVLPNAWCPMYPSPTGVFLGNSFVFVSETEAELAKINSQSCFSLQISINVTALRGLITSTREYRGFCLYVTSGMVQCCLFLLISTISKKKWHLVEQERKRGAHVGKRSCSYGLASNKFTTFQLGVFRV